MKQINVYRCFVKLIKFVVTRNFMLPEEQVSGSNFVIYKLPLE